jgi:hypothetical protein
MEIDRRPRRPSRSRFVSPASGDVASPAATRYRRSVAGEVRRNFQETLAGQSPVLPTAGIARDPPPRLRRTRDGPGRGRAGVTASTRSSLGPGLESCRVGARLTGGDGVRGAGCCRVVSHAAHHRVTSRVIRLRPVVPFRPGAGRQPPTSSVARPSPARDGSRRSSHLVAGDGRHPRRPDGGQRTS